MSTKLLRLVGVSTYMDPDLPEPSSASRPCLPSSGVMSQDYGAQTTRAADLGWLAVAGAIYG